MDKIYYFDNAATTRPRDEVIKLFNDILSSNYANPSSIYKSAQIARGLVEEARLRVAQSLLVRADEIYFTSGGSESNNLAIKGLAMAAGRGHIITSQVEHSSVLEPCRFLKSMGYELTCLPVDNEGRISTDDLKRSIRSNTILITIMTANNEVGVIQPIADIADIALKHGIHFHTDAIAAIPTMSIDLNNPGITSLSMAAHKIYGPKGAGVMFLRKDTPMISLMHGAQQEFNKRAGTENVAAIAATGLCIDILARKRRDEVLKIRRLRDLLLQGIQSNINKWVLNGPIIDRLPCNVNVSFINKAADTLLMQLDAMGICASSGSACSSGAIDDSHVLKAMGLPTCVINGAIRFSIGIYNEEEDVNVLIKALTELCE